MVASFKEIVGLDSGDNNLLSDYDNLDDVKATIVWYATKFKDQPYTDKTHEPLKAALRELIHFIRSRSTRLLIADPELMTVPTHPSSVVIMSRKAYLRYRDLVNEINPHSITDMLKVKIMNDCIIKHPLVRDQLKDYADYLKTKKAESSGLDGIEKSIDIELGLQAASETLDPSHPAATKDFTVFQRRLFELTVNKCIDIADSVAMGESTYGYLVGQEIKKQMGV